MTTPSLLPHKRPSLDLRATLTHLLQHPGEGQDPPIRPLSYFAFEDCHSYVLPLDLDGFWSSERGSLFFDFLEEKELLVPAAHVDEAAVVPSPPLPRSPLDFLCWSLSAAARNDKHLHSA